MAPMWEIPRFTTFYYVSWLCLISHSKRVPHEPSYRNLYVLGWTCALNAQSVLDQTLVDSTVLDSITFFESLFDPFCFFEPQWGRSGPESTILEPQRV